MCNQMHTKLLQLPRSLHFRFVIERCEIFVSNQTVFVYHTENPSEPFGASVIIDGVTYGTGTASSKKLAKNKAGKLCICSTSHCGGLVCICQLNITVLAQCMTVSG